jgi:hypothetical protein
LRISEQGGCGGDMELIEVALLLLLGLWGRLADMQIENSVEFVGGKVESMSLILFSLFYVQVENPIEFVIGQGGIDALNLFLLVVKHGDFIGEIFCDFHDDCLGLVCINGRSFFGWGSEFQLQNQGVGLGGHLGGMEKIAYGHGDIIKVGCNGGNGGKGGIHAFDLVLLVVKQIKLLGEFFHDFHDDCPERWNTCA